MLRRPAHFPDAQVGLPPVLQRGLHLAAHHRPDPAVQPLPAAQPDVDGLQHGAPDVVLALGIGLVADPDRPGPVVSAEVVQDPLVEHPLTVHPVHHLDLVIALGDVGQEPEEVVRLPVEAQRVQAPQGERGVAQPAVAVVPVALAVRHLGQRRAGRGDHGPARRERQALQGQRAALQVAAPRMVREAAAGQPVLPVVRGPDQPALRLLVVCTGAGAWSRTARRSGARPPASGSGPWPGRPRSRPACRWSGSAPPRRSGWPPGTPPGRSPGRCTPRCPAGGRSRRPARSRTRPASRRSRSGWCAAAHGRRRSRSASGGGCATAPGRDARAPSAARRVPPATRRAFPSSSPAPSCRAGSGGPTAP